MIEMPELNEHHQAVLQKISEKVYNKYGDKLVKRYNPYKDVEFVLKKALESDETSEEWKKQAKTILDSGIFSRKRDRVDSKVEKKMQDELQKEIDMHIKLGILPPLPTKEN